MRGQARREGPDASDIRSADGLLEHEDPAARRDLDAIPPRPERPRSMAIRAVLAIGVLAAVFGFALPRLADYGEAWSVLDELSAPAVATLLTAGLVNLVTYWPLLVLTLPGLRWREAMVVNQASTAVANTVPAGGIVALGMTFKMLHAWGFTTEAITNQVVVTGVWNNLVKFGLPVVAVAAVASTGELEGAVLVLAAWGLAALVVVVGGGGLLLRVESTTRRIGRALDRSIGWLLGRLGHGREMGIERWLVRLRGQFVALLGRSGIAMSVAAVASHLSLYLVLLTALRVTGIGGGDASWAKVLAAFALVRLLSAIPVTPGGVGVVELGYVGFLATGAADGLESRITAAVLLFRAITYVLPIGLGGVAWLVFQSAQAWRHPPDTRGAVPSRGRS